MAKKKTKSKTKSLVKKEYTDEEKARLAKYQERAKRKPVKFKDIVTDPDNPIIQLGRSDDPFFSVKMFEALGTPDPDIHNCLLGQVVQTFRGAMSSDGLDSEKCINAIGTAMAILNGIQPQDELEGMLAAQMIGVHNMAMDTLGRAILGNQSFEGKQANVNQATKMLRTFIAQMEALKKYRSGGQQKMIVEHVYVNEGGQAIVGTVNRGGGKNDKSCG